MRLGLFIKDNMELILAEWQAFAESLGAITSTMSVVDLRDHAERMLLAIVAELDLPQTAAAQEAKGKGHGPATAETAASTHGTGRQNDGFSLLQLTAEFRALRASVLRLWLPTITAIDATSMEDMTRFNEAMDQAIAESVATFSEKASEARDVFLAMLGHDLRSPLNTIGLTAQYLERPEVETSRRISSAKRAKRSAVAMTIMVNDLLEFSRLQLGGTIPIIRSPADLVEVAEQAVDDARGAHPACAFVLQAPDQLFGEFDVSRLAQVFANLLNNAAQYRTRETPVTLAACTEAGHDVVTVHNRGVPIPLDAQNSIFDPLVQLKSEQDGGEPPRSSVGLGLFIARKIVEAHGGTLKVTSTEDAGTVFAVRLPQSRAGLPPSV